MSKQIKLKLRPIVVALNILVLLIIILFYLSRMIYFYVKENSVVKNTGHTTFYSILVNKKSLQDYSKGLVYDEKTNTYTYKGLVEDNYIKYNGILYRIMKIDSSGNLKLVSNNTVTLMYSGLNKGFTESYINSWLNINEEIENSGYFEKNIVDKNKLLVKTNICNDVIDDLTKITCEKETYEEGFNIMTLQDYISAGAKESYLNNNEDFYLRTLNSHNNNYYVAATGEIGTDFVETRVRGVRVVLSIKANIKLISGDGTKDNPYIVEEHKPNKLTDLFVGEIINYSNNNWKVVEINEENIKIALTDNIKKEDTYVEIPFGKNNMYQYSNTIGKYLNTDYFNSLENNEYILDGTWYTGANSLSNLEYKAKYNSQSTLKIGILGLGDLFVNETPNSLTLTRGIEGNNMIMVINKDKHVYTDYISTAYNVRPALFINGELKIEKGNGTIKDPYIIKMEEKKEETSSTEE